MAKETRYSAIGRRKSSVAKVTITPGKGVITVNGKDVNDYMPYETLVMDLVQPLELVDAREKYDVNVVVRGGGFSGQTGAIRLGITRALLAVPGHACDSIFMGYYLTLAKQAMIQGNTSLENTNKIKSIIVPTILHGFYDFCLFAKGDYFIIIFFVFVVFLYIFSLKKIKHLSETNSNYYQRTNSNILNGYGQNFQTIPQNYPVQTTSYQQAQVQHEYCTNCGAVMFGPFCAKCGKRK